MPSHGSRRQNGVNGPFEFLRPGQNGPPPPLHLGQSPHHKLFPAMSVNRSRRPGSQNGPQNLPTFSPAAPPAFPRFGFASSALKIPEWLRRPRRSESLLLATPLDVLRWNVTREFKVTALERSGHQAVAIATPGALHDACRKLDRALSSAHRLVLMPRISLPFLCCLVTPPRDVEMVAACC